jgi:hypothetical protein
MNDEMWQTVQKINSDAAQLVSKLLAEDPCPFYAALKVMDGGGTIRVSGNSEGLVYLASVLLSLAVDRTPGQHIHLGQGEVLDEADKELVFAFQNADW